MDGLSASFFEECVRSVAGRREWHEIRIDERRAHCERIDFAAAVSCTYICHCCCDWCGVVLEREIPHDGEEEHTGSMATAASAWSVIGTGNATGFALLATKNSFLLSKQSPPWSVCVARHATVRTVLYLPPFAERLHVRATAGAHGAEGAMMARGPHPPL